uniref:Uncharacterized protein n=1 Tax=Romanomermis culicivorax TaxID=13658 RepID=A0A915HGK6_ROMCU
MCLEDKEMILANRKNLAEWNKSQKPLIIVVPDLTKQQRATQKEKQKSKEERKEITYVKGGLKDQENRSLDGGKHRAPTRAVKTA